MLQYVIAIWWLLLLQQYLIATTLATSYDGLYVGSNMLWLGGCVGSNKWWLLLVAICHSCYVCRNIWWLLYWQQYLMVAMLTSICDGCYVGSNMWWLLYLQRYVIVAVLVAICNGCYAGRNLRWLLPCNSIWLLPRLLCWQQYMMVAMLAAT